MSYMLTSISLYGVTLSYEEALRVLNVAGDIGFLQEYLNDFQSLVEEFGKLDPFDMKLYYDDLKLGIPAKCHPYQTFDTFAEFFDYFRFPMYQVRPEHRMTIPTVYDKRRDIQYHRYRYYTDLF